MPFKAARPMGATPWNSMTLSVTAGVAASSSSPQDGESLTFTLDADFASFPYEVGNGCGEILTITGCTDAGATNYDPDANEDDGSCEFASCPLIEVKFVTYTFGNAAEVSWTMDGTDETTGDTISMTSVGFSDNGVHTHTTCMAAGCYGMTLHDDGGDGLGPRLARNLGRRGPFDHRYVPSRWHQRDGLRVGVTCGEDPEVGRHVTNANMSGWNDGVDFSPYPTPTGEIVNVLGTGFDNEAPVVIRVRDGMGRIVRSRKWSPDRVPKAGSSTFATGRPVSTQWKASKGARRASARFVVAR